MKHRSLVVAGAALMLVFVSSGGLATPPADSGPSSSPPTTDARISELEAEVAALSAEVAMLATVDARVPEPDPSTSVFLKLAGIAGDSVRDGHEDEIEAVAWSWRTLHPAGEGARSRDIVVLKEIDSASAPLFQACAGGDLLSEATLTLRRTVEGETSDFFILTLENVRVTSVEHGVQGNRELVTLSASKIQLKYDDTIVAGWDFAADAPA